ncbi:MAG TPA: hypothetical protein VIV12_16160 [Streptosporangiaceae bacterium]
MPAITASASTGVAVSAGGSGAKRPIPLLAYYYIWYNASSWNRGKLDYPLIGRYSSDDDSVMRQQVALAKSAGISGFLVSWKNTPLLDRRLAKLRAVASAAGFNLGIVFEARHFDGTPLPMTAVRSSFRYLAANVADDPVFNIFGRPLVAWSGTWEFRHDQIAAITRSYGGRLFILGMEKEPAAYRRASSLFQGNAYYWSSVDPLRTPGYGAKLRAFSAVVHQGHGLWIAPAAPGFDARLVGGSRVIPRRNGQTLRLEMNAALSSSPDAIGLISWNEYSENIEVEPSRAYHGTALAVVAAIEHAKAPRIADFDSSAPSGFHAGPSQFVIVGALIALTAGSVVALARRRGRGP